MASVDADPPGTPPKQTSMNMALQSVFEPGSINKVVTYSAVLEEGVADPDTGAHGPERARAAHPHLRGRLRARHRALARVRGAGPLVEHRHHRAGAAARAGAARLVAPALRPRPAHRAPLPRRGQRDHAGRGRLVGHLDRRHPDRPGERRQRRADARRLQPSPTAASTSRRRSSRPRSTPTASATTSRTGGAPGGVAGHGRADDADAHRRDRGRGRHRVGGPGQRLPGGGEDRHRPQARRQPSRHVRGRAPTCPRSPASCPPRTPSSRSSWSSTSPGRSTTEARSPPPLFASIASSALHLLRVPPTAGTAPAAPAGPGRAGPTTD